MNSRIEIYPEDNFSRNQHNCQFPLSHRTHLHWKLKIIYFPNSIFSFPSKHYLSLAYICQRFLFQKAQQSGRGCLEPSHCPLPSLTVCDFVGITEPLCHLTFRICSGVYLLQLLWWCMNNVNLIEQCQVNTQKSLNYYHSSFSIKSNTTLLRSLKITMENQIRAKSKDKHLQKHRRINFWLRYNQMQSIDTIINSYLVLQINAYMCG